MLMVPSSATATKVMRELTNAAARGRTPNFARAYSALGSPTRTMIAARRGRSGTRITSDVPTSILSPSQTSEEPSVSLVRKRTRLLACTVTILIIRNHSYSILVRRVKIIGLFLKSN